MSLIHCLQLSELCYKKAGNHRDPLEYTERDLKIINGEYVLTLRKADVTRLIQKARERKEPETIEKLKERYKEILESDVYYLPKDKYAIEGGPGVTEKDALRALKKAIELNDQDAITKLKSLYDISEEQVVKPYYSDHDMNIMNGTFKELKKADVTRLINKALAAEDYDIAVSLEERFGGVLKPPNYVRYQPEESWNILCELDKKFAEEHDCKFIQDRPKPRKHRYKARRRKRKR